MKEIVQELMKRKLTISTMESCTGGLLANSITNIPNASLVFKFGAVTYSNEYKIKFNVSSELIDKYSVYSIEVAKEMSKKISDFTNSDIGIGVTGIIDRPDPNNPSDNDIYYAIIINDKEFTHKYIPDSNIERFEQKNYIANNIGVYLIDMLYEELGE